MGYIRFNFCGRIIVTYIHCGWSGIVPMHISLITFQILFIITLKCTLITFKHYKVLIIFILHNLLTLISWDFLGFPGISWDFLGFPGISWDFLGFLGISWDFLGFLGISRASVGAGASDWNGLDWIGLNWIGLD